MDCRNLSDYHIHTYYSPDSKESPENVLLAAKALGLRDICFTDHMDLEYPQTDTDGSPMFVFDTGKYFDELSALQTKYSASCGSDGFPNIKIGIELGLTPELSGRNKDIAASKPFDFVIGSTHLIDMQDPYFPETWQGRQADDVIARYFEMTYENVKAFSSYDVYGHLDYVTRYVPDKSYVFSPQKHMDIIDAILRKIIDDGHGIEVNTSPLYKGFGAPNPGRDILFRYRSLGGEIITIGSDAHQSCNVGRSFGAVRELLLECGFRYYSVFCGRKPEMVRL